MHPQSLTGDQLLDILGFKIEVMNQMLLASTLLAGLAMGVASVLLTSPERSRLRSVLLAASITSALLFIFATMLDACILPAMKNNAANPVPDRISGLLTLSSVVVWALLLGAIGLFSSIGGLGFAYSRKLGLFTAAAATTIAVGFVAMAAYLDNVVRR